VPQLDAGRRVAQIAAEVVVADMLDIIAVRAALACCSVVYFTMSISVHDLEAAGQRRGPARSLGVKAFGQSVRK